MVAIIFSMLSEGCSKLIIYTECQNLSFLKELAVVLSFLSNLWPWLYLNFLFCHRSCIYWAWNCEMQVWNRSLVSALVMAVYKQRWVLCRARKACEYFPTVVWKHIGSWEQLSVLCSLSSADRLWLACWMLYFSPSLESLQVKCSLFSCFCFAWQRGWLILPRVKKCLWTFPKSTGLMASAPCMSWALWCFPKWFYMLNWVLALGTREQDGSLFTNAFQWPDKYLRHK